MVFLLIVFSRNLLMRFSEHGDYETASCNFFDSLCMKKLHQTVVIAGHGLRSSSTEALWTATSSTEKSACSQAGVSWVSEDPAEIERQKLMFAGQVAASPVIHSQQGVS